MPAPRTPAPRAARAARPGTAPRRPLTPQEAARLQALLAARAAGTATAPRGTAPRATAPRPGRPRTAAQKRAAQRRAAARRAAERAARRAALRARLVGEPGRWRHRVAVVVAAVVLPALLGLLLPTQPAPAATPVAATDPVGLALAAQSSLTDQATRYRQLQQELAVRRGALAMAEQAEQAARDAAAADRAIVGAAAADLYRMTPEQRVPLLALDVHDPATTDDVLYLQAVADTAGTDLEGTVVRAVRAGDAVAVAAARVESARAAVRAGERQAAELLARVRAQVGELAVPTAAQLAALTAVPVAGDEADRNLGALRRWQDYLTTLATAGIEPPLAAELADPAALPAGLSAALDGTGQPIPGVAWAVAGNRPVTVLPAETVTAVSSALAQVGKPYADAAAGPEAYDCGGFTSTSWLLAGYALPSEAADQWTTGAAVPVGQLQTGDLVFSDGGADVGIYLGAGEVLGASAAGYRVGVRVLSQADGAVRVTLPSSGTNPALPVATSGNGDCGARPVPLGPVSPAWGGWGNGQIPASALCPIAPGHALRCDAAAAYGRMAAAFAATFGTPLCITDSYRSMAAQVTAFRKKPALAAVPGTSNHGWALAVDLCGGINRAGSVEWQWMAQNAWRFGFVQPDWAGPGGEKPEPWHWEFGNLIV
ncbi:NlpC/P60 family protein [Blastococcus sp. SYSU D00820]